MKNVFLPILCLFTIAQTYSQARATEIITKQNDTIKSAIIKNRYTFNNELLMSLQEKLVILDKNGVKKEYFPNELKSFRLQYESDSGQIEIQYENIDDRMFGQLMYAEKLRLLKVNTRNYFVFIIKRPNDGKTSYMEAMGLSRLISLKVISREMADCPDIIKKVDEKVLKVHGEAGVIELAKDYESNCLK
ncbi:hypothetical protein [Flavobacterium sp. 25HG05S-40]|uniref:hypothetical protein n=1 Tax=Flavobacterium sp. 25HG05S-40 TaxID=3458682 RepID=UPI00404464F0